jgi:hypothetical protein
MAQESYFVSGEKGLRAEGDPEWFAAERQRIFQELGQCYDRLYALRQAALWLCPQAAPVGPKLDAANELVWEVAEFIKTVELPTR